MLSVKETGSKVFLFFFYLESSLFQTTFVNVFFLIFFSFV